MALPASLGTVTLHATCLHGVTGAPLGGTVTFTPQGLQVLAPDADVALLPGSFTATLDAGELEVVLPVTNDPEFEPATSYKVAERFEGVTNRAAYYVSIDTADAGGTVELFALAALPEPTAATLSVAVDGGPW